MGCVPLVVMVWVGFQMGHRVLRWAGLVRSDFVSGFAICMWGVLKGCLKF